MKYIKIFTIVAFLALSVQFVQAKPSKPAIEFVFLQRLPPPPPRPPGGPPPPPFAHHRHYYHHRRHHPVRIRIHLPPPPPHP